MNDVATRQWKNSDGAFITIPECAVLAERDIATLCIALRDKKTRSDCRLHARIKLTKSRELKVPPWEHIVLQTKWPDSNLGALVAAASVLSLPFIYTCILFGLRAIICTYLLCSIPPTSVTRHPVRVRTCCWGMLCLVYRCRRGELFDYLTDVVTLNETRTRFIFSFCSLSRMHYVFIEIYICIVLARSKFFLRVIFSKNYIS